MIYYFFFFKEPGSSRLCLLGQRYVHLNLSYVMTLESNLDLHNLGRDCPLEHFYKYTVAKYHTISTVAATSLVTPDIF